MVIPREVATHSIRLFLVSDVEDMCTIVLVVCPTYCFRQVLRVMRSTTFKLIQLILCLKEYLCPVVLQVKVAFLIKREQN